MNLKNKKLLILAGSDVYCKVVEAANDLEVYTIVTDYLEDSPAKKIADESQMYSITDVEGIVDFCIKNKVDGVLNFCNDTAQMPYQEICEKLGLPCFCTKDQVLCLSNKKLFKEMCIRNNVDVIPEYSEKDVVENKVDYPVIVKPIDSRGSRGISRCINKQELLFALKTAKNESKTGQAIIEKCMYGKQDFTMTYFFVAGEPYLIRVGDRHLGKPEYGMDRQCSCLIAPSRYKDLYIDKIDKKIRNMLINLGIQNGPVFMQGFIDDDKLRVYDPGIRFPGGDYEKIYRDTIGVDLMKAMVQFAITGTMDVDKEKLSNGYNLNNLCSIQLLLDAGPGIIEKFDGLDEVMKDNNVIYTMQKAFPSDEIRATGDVKQQIGEIGILMQDEEEAIKSEVSSVLSKITVESSHGANLLLDQIEEDFFIRC